MDYSKIISDIKPNEKEISKIQDLSKRLIDYLNTISIEEKINCKIKLVGSVSKGTVLKGQSDIDLFIAFPLETPIDVLKEMGLYLGFKCTDAFNGQASTHYASHPYVNSIIENVEVDFVPCYEISDGSQLKSAVDRTILHTEFVKSNLQESQKDEVLLLKQFMAQTGTYGSEVKVGGFAGYMCELLIINYGSFENVIKAGANWEYGTVIDLKDYGTSELFNDPLITIDPTDKNRNVAAALRLDKMSEFIISCRNYLESNNKEDYFYPLNKNKDINKEYILKEFNKRATEVVITEFDIPDIPLDTLHPQIKKTAISLGEKLTDYGFNVFKADYWTDEVDTALIILEIDVSSLSKMNINQGPKIYNQKACSNFIKAHGKENCYLDDDFIVVNSHREFTEVKDYIDFLLRDENIHLIKVGKNLKESIVNTKKINKLNENFNFDSYELLNFFDDFINPNQYLFRD